MLSFTFTPHMLAGDHSILGALTEDHRGAGQVTGFAPAAQLRKRRGFDYSIDLGGHAVNPTTTATGRTVVEGQPTSTSGGIGFSEGTGLALGRSETTDDLIVGDVDQQDRADRHAARHSGGDKPRGQGGFHRTKAARGGNDRAERGPGQVNEADLGYGNRAAERRDGRHQAEDVRDAQQHRAANALGELGRALCDLD